MEPPKGPPPSDLRLLLLEEGLFPKFDVNLELEPRDVLSPNVEKSAVEAFSALDAKVNAYQACFLRICYSPQLQQDRETAQSLRSSSSVKRPVGALLKSATMQNYHQFRTELRNDSLWQRFERQIASNSSLPQAEIQSKIANLSKLKSDFCFSEACVFAHYSPQAFIRACELLAELETIRSTALHSMGRKSPSSRIQAKCITHLENFREAVEREKAKIVASLQVRFKIIYYTKNLAEGDPIRFIVNQLNLLGISIKIKDFAGFEQTEEELNTLLLWYKRFGAEKATDPLAFFPVSSQHHPILVDTFYVRTQSDQLLTCLQITNHKVGLFQSCSGFLGPSPAILIRYSFLVEELPDSCSGISACEKWVVFASLALDEIKAIPKTDSSYSDSENQLIGSWKTWWKWIGIECLKKAKSLLAVQDADSLEFRVHGLERFRLIAIVNQTVGNLQSCDLNPSQKLLIDQWREAEEIFYNQCVGLAIRLLNSAALACSNQSDAKTTETQNFLIFISKIQYVAESMLARDNWRLLVSCLEQRMPAPLFADVWEFFRNLKRPADTLSIAHDFLRILSENITSFDNPYLPLFREIDSRLQHEASLLSPPAKVNSTYSIWVERIERQVELNAAHVLSALAVPPQSTLKPDKHRLETFFGMLLHFPERTRLFNQAVNAFIKNKFQPSEIPNLFLTHALTPIEESYALEEFLISYLSHSPSIESLLLTFSSLVALFRKFPSSQAIIKKWLKDQIKNCSLPHYLVCDNLQPVVEMGCPDSQEEIFFTIDTMCLDQIKELVQTHSERYVSIASFRTFQAKLTAYSYPVTERGRCEYHALLARFQPDSWNPLIWECLRTWGPKEVAQEWRFAWLKSFASRRQQAGLAQDVFTWNGFERGYFRLRELFGGQLLAEAIEILAECCKKVTHIDLALQALWRELSTLLVIESSTFALESRDSLVLKNYWDLVAHFQQNIAPGIQQGLQVSTFVQQSNWHACVGFVRDAIQDYRTVLLHNLFWHLESGLARQFIETKSIDLVPQLIQVSNDFQRHVLEPISSIHAAPDIKAQVTAFYTRMNQMCLHMQRLHKFYRAFSSHPYHDWMLNFEEDDWTQMFPLMNERMLSACLQAFNQQFAVCIVAESRFAWLVALNLLQGSHSNVREGLEIIEKALIKTRRVSDDLHLLQAVDLQIFPLKKWRQALNFFLPKERETTAFSLTRGACGLHPLLQQTLKPNGECSVEKQAEHSHPVQRIRTENVDVYFKWEPCAFGLQFLDHVLFEIILEGHTPFQDFIKIKDSTGFFQLSETIPGTTLDNLLWDRGAAVPRIDELSYSKNFVRICIDCEWDGKSTNYAASSTGDEGNYSLTMIDNELVFNRPYIFREGKKLEVQMTSILFCFDQIHEPLHEEVVKRILALDIYNVLKEVLIVCKQARRRMISCVEEKEESHAWERSDARYLGISIQQRYLEHWVTTLERLKQLLASIPNLTHFQLLEALYPPIVRSIHTAHRSFSHPETRFEYLYRQKYEQVTVLREGRPRKTLLTKHSKQVLQTCLTEQEHPSFAPKNTTSMGIDDALTLLGELKQENNELKEIRHHLIQGHLAPFHKLRLQYYKELALWGTAAEDRLKWPTLSPILQKELLESIANNSFENLHLKDCQGLTKEILESLINNSPTLQSLDVTGVDFLTHGDVNFIISNCPLLKILNISRTPLSKLSFTCSSLSQLIANECNFKVLEVSAPKLKLVSLNNCYHLSKIDLHPHSSCRIESSGCALEAAVRTKLVVSYAYVKNQSKPHEWSGEFMGSSMGHGTDTIYNTCVAMEMTKQIEAFLKKGEKWIEGKNKRNPLHVAVSIKNDALIALLGLHSEFPYHTDDQNQTPLMQAAAEGYLPAVKILIGSAQASLAHATLASVVTNLGSRLSSSSINSSLHLTLNDRNIGLNALICAARTNQIAIIEFLLPNLESYGQHTNCNFGVNTKNFEGKTALGEAINRGHVEAMNVLMDAGAELSEEHILSAAEAGKINIMTALSNRNVKFSPEVMMHLNKRWE